ncbi:MAG TPA: hypothetical protein VEJ47_08285 [Candidatus Eremiobacteraceae bacterium]|nr:hypothetical protein [Candidatus Eremiobacteraceae bacterium]
MKLLLEIVSLVGFLLGSPVYVEHRVETLSNRQPVAAPAQSTTTGQAVSPQSVQRKLHVQR